MRHQVRRLQRISGSRHHRVLPARAGRTETVSKLEKWRAGGIVSPAGLHFSATLSLHSSAEMKHRLLRVNELLKRELSSLIARDLTFDFALLTVNQVDVTANLKNAHIFVSVLVSESKPAVMAKLEAHRAVLQADLAKHVVLKYTPHLVFHTDDSIERGARVMEILQELEEPEKSEE